MWNYVGIVRSATSACGAPRTASRCSRKRSASTTGSTSSRRDLLELRNIADVAELIVACAAARKESRGLHYTLDHPERDDAHYGGDTHVVRGSSGTLVFDFVISR